MTTIYKQGDRVTMVEVATGMRLAPQTLRILMQRNLIDVGVAFKVSGKRYSYLFDEEKLRKMGYEVVKK